MESKEDLWGRVTSGTLKVRYIGKSSPIYCIKGKEYEVIGKPCGYWRVVDESGEDFLYRPKHFEVIEGNPDELEEASLETSKD